MPKVTVVIPVYNVEKYLCQCLDSVISQTLTDIEIICVDDGSTDHCPEILDEYSKRDARVKVIHKLNEGYGKALNVGMKAANGEYIGIVESDDYILPEMYERLYTEAKDKELDLIKSDVCLFWGDYSRKLHSNTVDEYYNRVLGAEHRNIYFQFIMNTWTGIYNRKFILENNIFHNETPGASYQDQGFWVQTMSMCKKAEWLSQAFYMYRQDNPASSVKSRTKMLALLEEYNFIENILLDKKLIGEYRISNYYRMKSHKASFTRIADDLKYEYANIVKADFEKHKDVIDVGKSAEEMTLMKWLKEISENPVKVCDSVIEEKRNLSEKLHSAESLIVYGTGIRASKVCDKLKTMGLFNKVLGIVETEVNEKKNFFGFEVQKAEEVLMYDKPLVLISVKKDSAAYMQILENLNQYGINNYCDVEAINFI